MKKLLLAILAVISIFSSFTCDSTEPTEDIYPPGRRDYVWTVDTVKFSNVDYLSPSRIWASALNNIWVTTDANLASHKVIHFDGFAWKGVPVTDLSNPVGIFGFGKDQLWLSNHKGEFWNYDGTNWELKNKVELPGVDIIFSQNIYGSSPNEIYSIGFRETFGTLKTYRTIVKYNGSSWNLIDTSEHVGNYVTIRHQVTSGWYFIDSRNLSTSSDRYKLFVLKDDVIYEIHSGSEITGVSAIGNEVYLSIDKAVFKYNNDGIYLWKDFSSTDYIGRIWGRTETDFFTLTCDGIGHYNGTDLITIYKTDLSIREAIIFQQSIIFLAQGSERDRFFIIHGEIK